MKNAPWACSHGHRRSLTASGFVTVPATLTPEATLIMLIIMSLILDLRISAEGEPSGLDLTPHGESAYKD